MMRGKNKKNRKRFKKRYEKMIKDDDTSQRVIESVSCFCPA